MPKIIYLDREFRPVSKSEAYAAKIFMPDGRILFELKKSKQASRKHSHAHAYARKLTPAERRVDFAAIERLYNEDATAVTEHIKQLLKPLQQQTLDLIERTGASGAITPQWVASLRLTSSQDLTRTIQDYLVAVWRTARDKALAELPDGEQEKLRAMRRYALSFIPDKALDFLLTKSIQIKGVIDRDIEEAVRFDLFEHLKGGRPLQETMSNLRRIFEPFVGDPTKIAPSGITQTEEDILQAYRLENIVRTETTEALNMGRRAVGDATDGWVTGYELSAILDMRTCFAARTLIKLVDGRYIPIEGIKPGDYIVSGNGRGRSVAACWRYVSDCWIKLSFSDGRSVVCTPTHKFWNGVGWVEARDLEISDEVVCEENAVQADESVRRINHEAVQSVWPELLPLQLQSPQVLLDAVLCSMDKSKFEKAVGEVRGMHEGVSGWEAWPREQVLLVQMYGVGQKERAGRKNLQRVQEEFYSTGASNEKVLFPSLLSRDKNANEVTDYQEKVPSLQEYIYSNKEVFSPNGVLLAEMRKDFQETRSTAESQDSCLPVLQSQEDGAVETEQTEAENLFLLNGMPIGMETELLFPSALQNMPKANQREEIVSPGVLLFEVLPNESETNQDRAYGRGSPKKPEFEIYSRVSDGKKEHRFLPFSIQDGAGDGWNILASRSGCRSKEDSDRKKVRNKTIEISLQQRDSANSRFTSAHADHSIIPSFNRKISIIAKEHIKKCDWAYDLEIESDHSYLAEGLVAHNTEICIYADGLKVREDDARSIQLTPPLHFQCRSLLIFITKDDLPVKWATDVQLDKAVRLVQSGFK